MSVIKGDAQPYQQALAAWNKFRGYTRGSKTNFERIEDADIKRKFIQTLHGDAYIAAQRDWEAEYQELINEDNRLCNAYRDLYFEHKQTWPKGLEELPGWEQKLNPNAVDIHEWEKEKLAKGRVVVGWGDGER